MLGVQRIGNAGAGIGSGHASVISVAGSELKCYMNGTLFYLKFRNGEPARSTAQGGSWSWVAVSLGFFTYVYIFLHIVYNYIFSFNYTC